MSLALQAVLADIPKSAVQVKVTNVHSPYCITLYGIKEHQARIPGVRSQLDKYVRSWKKKEHTKLQFGIGDFVILTADSLKNAALPELICRGVVTEITASTANVFLLDYGGVYNVSVDCLILYHKKFISYDFLVSAVSLYNIIPVDTSQIKLTKNQHSDVDLVLSKDGQWPLSTVEFVKKLIGSAEKLYFEVLASDQDEKGYGELYLVMKNNNMSLRKLLIHHLMASEINDEFKKIILDVGDKSDYTFVPYAIGFHTENSTSHEQSSNDVSNGFYTQNGLKNNSFKGQKKSFEKKIVTSDIMVRSHHKIKPLDDISDAKFMKKTHKNLEDTGIFVIKKIQAHMWPAIKNGLNVVAINPKASGKTIGYVAPICNYIITNEESILEMQKSEIISKPNTLILCSCVEKVMKVGDMFDSLLGYNSKIRVLRAYNGVNDKTVMTGILNRSSVIVSTPPYLLRFMDKYSAKLNLSALSFLVTDHIDVILDKYSSEFLSLVSKYKIFDEQRVYIYSEKRLQMISSAMCWTKPLKNFVQDHIENPYICIGSFLEAAAFCKVIAKMSLRDLNKKNQHTYESLGEYNLTRTMVICLNINEAIGVDDYLKFKGVKTLLAHEDMGNKLNEVKKEWTKAISGDYPVIICTDDVLSILKIFNIEYLIHYNITTNSKTRFTDRFSVLMNNWITDSSMTCKVLIIVDNSVNIQFRGLLNILDRLGTEIPNDWREISKNIYLQSNKEKKKHPLCDMVKQFGNCEVTSCCYRHCIFPEVDQPQLPLSPGDEVRMNVNCIHNATYFNANLLEYEECETKKEVVLKPHQSLNLFIELRKYYRDPKNRRLRKDVSMGEVCVWHSVDEDTYKRVRVLEIVDKYFDESPRFVRVQEIDHGLIYGKISVHSLYETPDKFINYKTNCFHVFIAGVVPFDGDYKWSLLASQDVKEWFDTYCKKASIAVGKVIFCSGHNIWLKDVDIKTKISRQKYIKCSKSIKDVLIQKGHGIDSKEHIKKLQELFT